MRRVRLRDVLAIRREVVAWYDRNDGLNCSMSEVESFAQALAEDHGQRLGLDPATIIWLIELIIRMIILWRDLNMLVAPTDPLRDEIDGIGDDDE